MAITKVAASLSLIALFVLCLAWETVAAPLRPGGSYIAFKALPLLLPLAGILAGKVYTYQWSSMLILAYLGEGAMRALSERGTSQMLALLEIILSVVFFAAVVRFVRLKKAGA